MAIFPSMSIRKQLWLTTLIMAFSAVVVIVYSGLEKRNEDIVETRRDVQQLADEIASDQKNLVAGAQQLMGALSQLPEVKSHDTVKAESFLADILKMNPQFVNIFIVDRDGNMWASAAPMERPFSVKGRRFFSNVLETGRFSSGGYIIGRTLRKPTFSFGYPVKDKRGNVDGVLVVNFDLEHVRNFLQASKLFTASTYLLIDHNGTIISRGVNPAEFVGKPYRPELFKIMQELPDGGTRTGPGVDGIERFSYYRKLYLKGEREPYMYVCASIPTREITTNANRFLFQNLMRLFPFIIIAFFLSWIISKRSIVDRLKALEQAAQQLARGDREVRVSDLVAGDELGSLAQAFDAMARKLLLRESELSESKKFLSTIIETEPECVKLLAADGSIIMMNRAGLDMIQVETFDQVKGKAPYPLIDPEYLDVFKGMIGDVFSGKSSQLEFRIIGAKGRPLWLETHAVPLRNENGDIISLLGITQNITERKEIDRMKDEMISAVSHEMRTPLTAMMGYTEFLLGNKVDEAQMKEYLGIVRQETERLKELISNFLDMQRLRIKKGCRNFRPLAMRSLLEETATLFADASDKHHIIVNAMPELPLAFGDEYDLRTVLNHLLSNAVKYSPHGGSIVLDAVGDDNSVTLSVKDEGIGIPVEEQEKIFDRFYRVDNTDRRTTGGTGLGLALVRDILHVHGGSIWVNSIWGKGSTFYIALPVANDIVVEITKP